MLTRRGWFTGVLAGVLLVLGWIFGTIEGYIAGAVLAALLIGSVLWLVATRLDVSVTRVLHPPKVHAGCRWWPASRSWPTWCARSPATPPRSAA